MSLYLFALIMILGILFSAWLIATDDTEELELRLKQLAVFLCVCGIYVIVILIILFRVYLV